MKPARSSPVIFALALLISGLFSACESTGGGGSVSGGVYYGVGLHDPWYYGGYCDAPDVIVTPPPVRPVEPPRPSHPIVTAPPVARPMPSIPATPRVSRRR